ncbi:hypothetical protein [uncultured Pantoea sp.]|nr:hypothetical protein [uncultured Pantoea sp.]
MTFTLSWLLLTLWLWMVPFLSISWRVDCLPIVKPMPPLLSGPLFFFSFS